MIVTLTPEDVHRLRALARRKVAHCGGAGASRQQDGSTPEDSNLRGLAGQLAAARALGLPEDQVWSDDGSRGHRPDFWLPDGRTVDVKTVRKRGYRLAMHTHQGKPKDDLYVLVQPGEGRRELEVVGWIDGPAWGVLGHEEVLQRGTQWVLEHKHLLPPAEFGAVQQRAVGARDGEGLLRKAPLPAAPPLKPEGFFGRDADYYWWMLDIYRAGRRDMGKVAYWQYQRDKRKGRWT